MKLIAALLIILVSTFTMANPSPENPTVIAQHEIQSSIDEQFNRDKEERQKLITAIIATVKKNKQLKGGYGFEEAVRHCTNLVMQKYMPCKTNSKKNDDECVKTREIITDSLSAQIPHLVEATEIRDEYRNKYETVQTINVIFILFFNLIFIIGLLFSLYETRNKQNP
jgi:hypothetical protein